MSRAVDIIGRGIAGSAIFYIKSRCCEKHEHRLIDVARPPRVKRKKNAHLAVVKR